VWVLTIIVWSLPFLFSFWIVYRCLDSSVTRVLLAETCAFIAGFLLIAGHVFYIRDRPILVEQQPPLVEMQDSGRKPQFPLAYEAVGIETNGQFVPVMFLRWPSPGWRFKDVTFDLNAGAPKIGVYRGTNEIAANNFFLGEFQIIGHPKTKKTLDVMISFELSEKRQLFVVVRDKERNISFKLKSINPNQK